MTLTDKQKAVKLDRAYTSLRKAIDLLDEAVGNLSYFSDISFDLHCKSLEVQEAAHFLRHHEDSMR